MCRYSSNNILKEVEENSKESIEVVKKIMTISETQAKGVKIARDDYMAIEESIEYTQNVIDRLNESEKEIFKGKDNIVDTLNNLAVLANGNMQSTEMVKESMIKQTESTKEVSKSSKDLAKITEILKENIFKFDV